MEQEKLSPTSTSLQPERKHRRSSRETDLGSQDRSRASVSGKKRSGDRVTEAEREKRSPEKDRRSITPSEKEKKSIGSDDRERRSASGKERKSDRRSASGVDSEKKSLSATEKDRKSISSIDKERKSVLGSEKDRKSVSSKRGEHREGSSRSPRHGERSKDALSKEHRHTSGRESEEGKRSRRGDSAKRSSPGSKIEGEGRKEHRHRESKTRDLAKDRLREESRESTKERRGDSAGGKRSKSKRRSSSGDKEKSRRESRERRGSSKKEVGDRWATMGDESRRGSKEGDPRKQRLVPKKATSVFVAGMEIGETDSVTEAYLSKFAIGPKYKVYDPAEKETVFWMTNQISADFRDDDDNVLANVAEFVMFLIFMLVLCIVASNQIPSQRYHMERGLRRQIIKDFMTYRTQDRKISFYDIRDNNDIWHYLNVSLIEGEWLDHFYGPDRVRLREEVEVKPFWHIMGVPQIRQLRVRDDSCQIHPIFEDSITKCYTYFSEQSEQTDTISPVEKALYFDTVLSKKFNEDHWDWVSGKKTHHVDYSTPMATYSGGGYLVNLTRGEHSEIDNQLTFDYLREFVWLTRETRVVFVDFTVYNPNVKLMSSVKIVFEIPPTGGVYPSWDIRTVQMFHLVTWRDHMVFGFFCVLCVYGVFLAVEEIREMAYFKTRYFIQFWTYIDLAIVVLIFFTLICMIRIMSQVKGVMDHYLRNVEGFFCAEDLIFTEILIDRLLIILFFLGFLRIFRYLGYFGTIHQYYSTAKKCKSDLLCFSLSYFMIFFAFAQIGFFMFGRFNEDFHSLQRSMFTLVRMFFGYINYDKLVNSYPWVGAIYFLGFAIIVYYLMLSMFLIILYQNYVEEEAEIIVRKGPTAGRIMTGLCKKMFSYFFSKPPVSMPLDYITVGEIKEALAKLHFTQPEIDVFMRKYFIDNTKTVEPQDVPKIIKELQRKGLDKITADRGHHKLLPEMPVKKPKYRQLLVEEYNRLVTRIDQIELFVETMHERVIGILNLLEEGVFLHDPIRNPLR